MGSSLSYAAANVEGYVATFLDSARQGSVDAFMELGRHFSSGGLSANLIEAHKWFNLAASKGCEEAQQYRADVAAEMSLHQIAAAQRAARVFLRPA